MPQVYNMDNAFAAEWSSRLYMLAQQKGNILKPYADFEPFSAAASLFYDTLAPDTEDPTPNQTLHGDTPIVESNFNQRMLTPALWETGHLWDKDKFARIKINPQGSILSNDSEKFGRFWDKTFIAAALGSAQPANSVNGIPVLGTAVTLASGSIGINGDGTVTTLGTAPAANTAVGLTVTKIRTMKWLCDKANMGPNRVWVVDPGDIVNMLGQLQITSSDYNTVHALAKGEVDSFCGFKFVWLNGLLQVGTGANLCNRSFVFEANKAVKVIELSAMSTQMADDSTKKFNIRVYTKIDFGMGRTEEALVHECANVATVSAATIISQ
jgi:hypothetical protein